MFLTSVFKKQQILFDICDRDIQELVVSNQSFIRRYVFSKTKSNDCKYIDVATTAFKQASFSYNNLEMGDFLSYASLVISKELCYLKNTYSSDLERNIELEHYLEQLKKFKISLIVISSVKLTKEEKDIIFNLINEIKVNLKYKKHVFESRKIPLHLLDKEKYDVSFVKKHEKYILAILLVHMYHYKFLTNFVA